jgi:hypothetical protein
VEIPLYMETLRSVERKHGCHTCENTMQCGCTTETGLVEGMKCPEYRKRRAATPPSCLPREKTLTRQHLHPGTCNEGLRLGGLSAFAVPFWLLCRLESSALAGAVSP